MGCDIHGVFQKRSGDRWEDVESNYDEDRHYQLFAVLAGVRNGVGFAGVETGDRVVPISEPRGLPGDFELVDGFHPYTTLDLFPPWEREYRQRDGDRAKYLGDHSQSWLTGDELLTWFRGAQSVMHCGLLDRKAYAAWNGTDEPVVVITGAWGNHIVVVEDDPVAMSAQPQWTHARCRWSSSLTEHLAYFFDEIKRLVNEHGEIRFVFGFDS